MRFLNLHFDDDEFTRLKAKKVEIGLKWEELFIFLIDNHRV